MGRGGAALPLRAEDGEGRGWGVAGLATPVAFTARALQLATSAAPSLHPAARRAAAAPSQLVPGSATAA